MTPEAARALAEQIVEAMKSELTMMWLWITDQSPSGDEGLINFVAHHLEETEVRDA